MRVEFELAMPGRSSWNGKWSGDDRRHLVYRDVSPQRCAELDVAAEPSWTHSFGDGWVARITARYPSLEKRSDGFAGYDWMVESILAHGEIRS